jgi:hypothetical protein
VPDKNHSGRHFEMDMMMNQKKAIRGQVMELLSVGKVDQKEDSHNAISSFKSEIPFIVLNPAPVMVFIDSPLHLTGHF